MSDDDYWADIESAELGPCDECEGCGFCHPCGYDRAHCICQPKIQDLEPDGVEVMR